MQRRLVVLAVLLSFVLTGYVTQRNTPQSSEVFEPNQQEAILDWTTASFTLPINQYAMTGRESQIVEAAASIEFARCAHGLEADLSTVVEEARRYLTTQPEPPNTRWLFGWWNADFISKYGLMGYRDPPLSWVYSEWDVAQACQSHIADMGLIIITTDSVNIDNDVIRLASGTSYELTLVDSRFKLLQREWRDCVSAKGYVIDDDYETSAAYIDPSWEAERVQKIAIDEALCADSMRYTQQVTDLMAEYQNQYIVEHEGELFTIRNIAVERVITAKSILREFSIDV